MDGHKHLFLAVMMMSACPAIILNTAIAADEEPAGSSSVIEALQALVQQQINVNKQQSEDIEMLKNGLCDLEDQLENAEDTAQCSKQKVAFSAFFTGGKPPVNISENKPIPFNHATTNIGNGYDTQTGVFTAPTSGIYLFLLKIHGGGVNQGTTQVVLEKSGRDLAKEHMTYTEINTGHFVWDESTAFATAHVTAGDRVFVRRGRGGNSLMRWRFTAFTGVLLFAD